MEPLVSVIMPVYNDEKYLSFTIQSVLNQTYRNLELIIVNDGSIDKSKEIAEKFIVLDKRVKLISQENKGVSSARNVGIDNANGEYIAFIDSDDIWLPEKIDLQMKEFEKNDIGFVSCLAAIIDKENNLSGICVGKALNGNVFQEILRSNGIPCGSVPLIKRSVIDQCGHFDNSLNVCEDYEYWIRCSLICRFKTISGPLCAYRKSKSRLSSAYKQIFFNTKLIIEKYSNQYKIKNYQDESQLNTVTCCLLNNDIQEAKHILNQNFNKSISFKLLKLVLYMWFIEFFSVNIRKKIAWVFLGNYYAQWKTLLKAI